MIRQAPSIFNDIVGPTMIGPSSSHTCGPSRIGFLSQQFLKTKLQKATIEFATEGAYTLMYKGQRSDMGFANGLMGNRPENPELRSSLTIAKDRGLDIQFIVSDYEAIVPNIAKLTLYGENNEKVEIFSDSTGGGTVKLLKFNGFDISILGDCFELCLIIENNEENTISPELLSDLTALFAENENCMQSSKDNLSLLNFKFKEEISEELLEKIKNFKEVKEIYYIKPVLNVLSNNCANLPLRSAEELLKLHEETGKSIDELGIEYEMARSGWTREQVIDYMKYVINTMEAGVKAGLKGDIDMAGIIEPSSGKIANYMQEKKAIDMGVLNTAVPWAMATMEYSSAMGTVLCAPTGGSAGVFPGGVLGIANHLNLDMDEKVKAMFITSIIGIVMSKDCNYSAELYGCQVEPGAASAMAASALVYLMDGSAKQMLQAASCAIQNILGTICDPIGGLVQVPCISRNAMSVANALVSANMIMGGYDPLIPLDEAAETMFRVGKQLPSELRCTCRGGLCTTPSGIRLAKEQEERDNKRI